MSPQFCFLVFVFSFLYGWISSFFALLIDCCYVIGSEISLGPSLKTFQVDFIFIEEILKTYEDMWLFKIGFELNNKHSDGN